MNADGIVCQTYWDRHPTLDYFDYIMEISQQING